MRWAINPKRARRGEARQCGLAGSRQAQLLIGASAIHFPAGFRDETERVSPRSVQQRALQSVTVSHNERIKPDKQWTRPGTAFLISIKILGAGPDSRSLGAILLV